MSKDAEFLAVILLWIMAPFLFLVLFTAPFVLLSLLARLGIPMRINLLQQRLMRALPRRASQSR